jgi:transketolase
MEMNMFKDNQAESRQFDELLHRARRCLLKMHYDCGTGHIGGNLSALPSLLVLFHKVMKCGDRFVLSKGHAAGALYVSLWSSGRLDRRVLNTFHGEGIKLAGHPVAGWHPDITFGTGSLGHGLSLSLGLALGLHLQGATGRVFCLLSEGDLQEGSTWEAIAFGAQCRMSSLMALIDANGLQAFGRTEEVSSLEPLDGRLRAFGWEVRDIDGHDYQALVGALSQPHSAPCAVIMRTVKGYGVSFMEGRLEWHYLPLNEEQFKRAVGENVD